MLYYLYKLYDGINYMTGKTIVLSSNKLVFLMPLQVKRAEMPKMSSLKRP